MYLLDTNVISMGAPTRSPAHGLAAWMERNSAALYLSVITIAEIEDGIPKARRTGAAVKAARLSEWLDAIVHLYSARILALDVAASRVLGRLADRARATGQAPGFADLAIGAIAQVHGHVVLTRNLRHFRPLGVESLDPFEALPVSAGR